MRILHIAPQNISDVPMTLVRAERSLGHDSRLVTFFRDPRGYDEDVCLDLPFVSSEFAASVRRFFGNGAGRQVSNSLAATIPGELPQWHPPGVLASALMKTRERLWLPKLQRFFRRFRFWEYDLYQFDGGLDFFRDGWTAEALKKRGKRISVLYTGSDLRTRGIIEPLHSRADARFTVELDHLLLDPTLNYVPFPFETEKYAWQPADEEKHTLRIGHAPTNRKAKGTEVILDILAEVAAVREIEVVLIENLSHEQAIEAKATCDIFIDQIGDLGYGINALEALALGVPTCTGLAPGFDEKFTDHPFVEVDVATLYQAIIELIDSAELRTRLSRLGREWVEKWHDSREIVRRMHATLGEPASAA